MQYAFRPLQNWPFKETSNRRSRWTFKAPWSNTIQLLASELDKLDAHVVVIQADFAESDIRLDGLPRSNAKVPNHPGVIVSFESKFGPLQYASDACNFWEHNVRSIALGLESLRAVDRYGITRTGEQYTGWKALGSGIEMGSGNGAFHSAEEAAAFLREYGEVDGYDGPAVDIDDILASKEVVDGYYKRAAKRLHPDVGGEPELFKRLQEAKDIIGNG